ncbi:sporulation protein YqfC [Clostridium aestuarii]|uniref:Sporulation protein YqfC n=1 Tax=Clostridium aestuarii TaxID=338193 RepID=A0ABT4CZ41_9CLOT|nr:sporulation protein YqfC [Clostridium aestuarii]MCY6484251.1 sporulation protein YqfC [Clostridium aestuarii]
MRDKLDKTRENIAQKLDLPRDVVLNIPKITITGNNEIAIENHKGIVLFEENKMIINSNIGLILIEGERLEVRFIGGSTIIISGKFKTITYHRNRVQGE